MIKCLEKSGFYGKGGNKIHIVETIKLELRIKKITLFIVLGQSTEIIMVAGCSKSG